MTEQTPKTEAAEPVVTTTTSIALRGKDKITLGELSDLLLTLVDEHRDLVLDGASVGGGERRPTWALGFERRIEKATTP